MVKTLHPGGLIHQEEGWGNAVFQLKAFIDFLNLKIEFLGFQSGWV
jgi:hypothetical protein